MVEFSRVQLPLLAAPQLPRAFGVCFGHVRVVVQGTRGEAALVRVHGVGGRLQVLRAFGGARGGDHPTSGLRKKHFKGKKGKKGDFGAS